MGIRKQHRRKFFHPAFEKLYLIVANRSIRVIDSITLLRKNVQSCKQTERFVTVEVVDVTQAFLVEQLERQQAEQCVCRRNHLRTSISRSIHHSIKSQLRKQRQE